MASIYNKDNYYRMCFSSKYEGVTNYCVDRTDEVQIEDELVSKKAILPDKDIVTYTDQFLRYITTRWKILRLNSRIV